MALEAAGISSRMIRRRLGPRFPFVVSLSCSILLCCSPVLVSAAVVTLDSIEIFKTHEWFPSKPSVYFHCKGENKITLPDVKVKKVMYTFNGEESWQPLTVLRDKKCKRCSTRRMLLKLKYSMNGSFVHPISQALMADIFISKTGNSMHPSYVQNVLFLKDKSRPCLLLD